MKLFINTKHHPLSELRKRSAQTNRRMPLPAAVMAVGTLLVLCATGCTNGALSGAHAVTDATFTFEPAAGILVWWSTDNVPNQRSLTASEADSGSVTLSVRKDNMTPVMLYRENVLEPAGCIWPVSSIMDAAGGFSARMLWRLLTESDSASGPQEAVCAYCERFNWKRFCDVVATIENPWELNQQKILKAIADGTFTMKCLK